ncbi:AraC-type DNA-binding protein [Prosthecobacter debontii]|uniref:AraC-type DNA-binding protein n=1 Tax=Prosthecobacter debontii TaxID=48467 RepID=A0A1T4WUM5_9BACT|nr:AraC family transcriptional regulator [Prosthecobacter debontii]SKA81082.1 AraC-type DNA-binding protein [Prosthecobacter debontii]
MQTQTSQANGRQRFIETLAESDLFQRYQHAYHTLTGLSLTLRAQRDMEFVEKVETHKTISGVVETLVPVRVGKNPVALLQTGGVRLEPANAQTFAPLAASLLEDNHSADDVRSAQVHFHQVPVMEPERYDAAVAILCSFALQLGESAHRLLFAHAVHEPEAVRNAKIYIHAHLAEPMTLEAVAGAVNVSPFHFCKIFKRATGLTFTDFVNRARVEKAKRMLMKPAARITEVAYDVGFQSLSHFNRSFRRIASESPTEYRGRMREGNAPVLA